MNTQAAIQTSCDINVTVGENVRAARRVQGIPRRALAEQTHISERYIGQLETGRANISLNMLQKIASALEASMADLMGLSKLRHPKLLEFSERLTDGQAAEALDVLSHHFKASLQPNCGVALIGLRGAGKTTLGQGLAEKLGLEFVQLTARVGEQSGMSIQELVELAGIEAFRRFEQEAIETLIAEGKPVVLETGGGLVSSQDAYQLVLTNFRTVWVKASPEQHMQRVVDQNDLRPMQGNPRAMDHLRRLLAGREEHYGRADIELDTSEFSADQSLTQLIAAVTPLAGGSENFL